MAIYHLVPTTYTFLLGGRKKKKDGIELVCIFLSHEGVRHLQMYSSFQMSSCFHLRMKLQLQFTAKSDGDRAGGPLYPGASFSAPSSVTPGEETSLEANPAAQMTDNRNTGS